MNKRLGAYTIEGEVARGGQAAVWRARHDSGKVVALKVLAMPDHDSLKRFMQEARVLARLAHPNLLRVLDHGEAQGIPYLASELIDGEDLLSLVASNGLPEFAQTAQILVTIAHTLQHCHEQGIVHRDLKPANIMIERGTQRPVLVDFGMVHRDPKQMHLASLEHTQFSLSGSVKGTPEFMAPEQVDPQTFGEVSPRTDVYGLGATLYHLLTGRPPFSSGQLVATLRKVTRKAPEDPARVNPQVPRPLADLCLRCLSKQPAQRPPSAQAFARDLIAAAGISSVPLPPARQLTPLESTPSPKSSSPVLPSLGPRAGARLGPFTVIEELGRGGMGLVLKARHDDGREAAVKILSNLAAGERATKRFLREAKALAELDHPNVVGYMGSGTEPQPWLAMAFEAGGDLSDHLQTVGIPDPDETARIVAEIADGIAHAHAAGILHRDLKPANVLLAGDGKALVTDFGLARGLDSTRYTKSGDHVGTLAFMAPEQVEGKRSVSFPADVWAIGVILYRCLSGELPFAADSSVGLAGQIVSARIKRPRHWNDAVPADLEATCMACLHREIAERPSAAEVAAALRARKPLGPMPSAVSPRALLVGLLTMALVLGASAYGLASKRGDAPAVATTSGGDAGSGDGGGGTQPAGDPSSSAQAPPAERPPPAPWPAPQDGWQLVWFLGGATPPAVEDPRTWSEPGLAAAPLAALRQAKPGESLPGFLGEARCLEGQRVRIRYSDLVRAMAPEPTGPGDHFVLGRGGAIAVRSNAPGEGSLLAPNDTGAVWATLGEACWRDATLELRARQVAREDIDMLSLRLGVGNPDLPGVALSLHGRSGTVKLSSKGLAIQHRLGEEWQSLRFAPGAPEGQRLQVGSADVSSLDRALTERPPDGEVQLAVTEANMAFDSVVVEGEPLRVGVPALARVECPVSSALRIAVAFEGQDEDAWGGPCVALGGEGPWDQQLRLEVGRGILRLRRGHSVLAEAKIGERPRRGWLSLERDADRLRAVLSSKAGRFELRCVDPLPMPWEQPRAAYGSTGPSLRFSAVEVHAGADDPARRALDRTSVAGSTDAERILARLRDSEDPKSRWRAAAIELALVSDPRRAIPRVVGPSARPERLRRAAQVAERLSAVAQELTGYDKLDALARLVLANVVAARADAAEASARRLVEEAGLETARELYDRLLIMSADSLLPRTVKGYVTIRDVEVREAALRAAAVLSPGDMGEVLVARSLNIRNRNPPPNAKTAEGRAALEGALTLLENAKAAGYADHKHVSRIAAEYLMDLARWDEALAAWRHGLPGTTYYWGWLREAQLLAQLRRLPEAIEAALGALAGSRGQAAVHQLLLGVLQQTPSGSAPGRVAAGYYLLGDARKDKQLQWRAQQIAVTALAVEAPRERDLAAYVMVCSRQLKDYQGRGRPTAVIVHARLGDEDAQRAVKQAAAEDPLVAHIVRLDPQLAPLLQR